MTLRELALLAALLAYAPMILVIAALVGLRLLAQEAEEHWRGYALGEKPGVPYRYKYDFPVLAKERR